jgi:hypothetical protein
MSAVETPKQERRREMITIGIAKWPTEAVTEIAKRSIEMKPLPEFIQMIGPYMYPDENDGIVSITIFKYDKAKAGEASDAIANGFMIFYGVQGYTYSLKLASGSSVIKKMMGFA